MPVTIGPKVIGQEAYDAQVAAEVATGGGLIGSRVTGDKTKRAKEQAGPKVDYIRAHEEKKNPPKTDIASVGVAEAIAMVRNPDADHAALWAAEHDRPNGPRITVTRELQVVWPEAPGNP